MEDHDTYYNRMKQFCAQYPDRAFIHKDYTTTVADTLEDESLDFVFIGRAAVVHANFAKQALANPDFTMADLPVTRAHLAAEGLGPKFIDYMATWEGFVAP